MARSDAVKPFTAALIVCLAMLGAGLVLKGQCAVGEGYRGKQFIQLCYNDIQALYFERHIDERVFPYVSGTIVDGELRDGASEYPILTGLFTWGVGQAADNPHEYFFLTAPFLALAGLGTLLLLARMAPRRMLLWAAAPALVLYSFHNWDHFAVLAVTAAVWFWSKDEPGRAAVALGVGACLKLFPIMFLIPLFLDVRNKSDTKRALRTVGLGAAVIAIVNLPFILINAGGWFATYEYHSQRIWNLDSMWGVFASSLDVGSANLLSALLTLVTFAWILWTARLRQAVVGSYPFLQVSAAMLAGYMLWSKIQSPQYTLWLIPFFVLLRVRLFWWVAYALADIAVYIGYFSWAYIVFFFFGPDLEVYRKLMVVGIAGRSLLLAALIPVFLFSREAVARATDEPELSHPPPNLQPIGDRLPAQA
jgi:uncharacterized membrane protein